MRVLVADDDEELRSLVVTALAREGHDTRTAGTTSAALELAQAERFDVLVLDVMFPDGDGLEVCRSLRAEGVLTPILFLSARGAVSARVDGLEAGADDYLAKPFALRELLLRVRALGRRGPARADVTFEHEGLRVDLGARRAFRDKREIPLTGREWEVLAALAAEEGRVLSFEDLLERAWGDTSDGARNSLEVIIGRIRRKVDAPGHESLIRTVRGHGYALVSSP